LKESINTTHGIHALRHFKVLSFSSHLNVIERSSITSFIDRWYFRFK